MFNGCTSLTYNEYDNAYYIGNQTQPYLLLVKVKDYSITSCSVNAGTKCIVSYAFNSQCTSLTSVTIESGVTAISANAFYCCPSLNSITIPNTVTEIGYLAIFSCSSLESIIFDGTKAQWKQIEQHDSFRGTNNCIVTCTDGKVTPAGNEIT